MKKTLAIVLSILLVLTLFPVMAFAAGGPSIDAPQNVSLYDETYDDSNIVGIYLKLTFDDKLLKAITPTNPDDVYGAFCARIYYEFNLNGGGWFAYPEHYYDSFWNSTYYEGSNTYDQSIVSFQPGFEDQSRAEETFSSFKPMLKTASFSGYENAYMIDKENNTLEVRARYELVASDDVEGSMVYTSPWAYAKWGKGSNVSKPTAFSNAPVLSGINVQMSGIDQRPQVKFTAVHPDDVMAASTNPSGVTCFRLQVNYDNTGWQDYNLSTISWLFANNTSWTDLPDRNDGNEIKIDATAIQLRMRYEWYDGISQYQIPNMDEAKPSFTSPWSNTIGVNVGAWSNASKWAVAELEKADAAGLIPTLLKGADMTKPINRAEFAALSVRLYEVMSGKTAMPSADNPFTDTTDKEVLKAYNLSITSGTSPTTFQPNLLIPREQVATMLARTVKAVKPGLKIDTTGVTRFADDASISDWAKESVYFMAKNDIVGGVGNNKFAPKNTTKAEEAAGYANATREQAIAIAMRSLAKLK